MPYYKIDNTPVEVLRDGQQGDRGFNPARGPQVAVKNPDKGFAGIRLFPKERLELVDAPAPEGYENCELREADPASNVAEPTKHLEAPSRTTSEEYPDNNAPVPRKKSKPRPPSKTAPADKKAEPGKTKTKAKAKA